MWASAAKDLRLWRAAGLVGPLVFWAAAAIIFAAGVAPPSKAPSIMPWDKAEHFCAFYGLMGLGAGAYARRPLWQVALVVSGLGGLLELVQALPMVGRDCDVWDWVADSFGVLAVIAPTLLPGWRAWRNTPPGAAGG